MTHRKSPPDFAYARVTLAPTSEEVLRRTSRFFSPTTCGNDVREVTEEWMAQRAKRRKQKEDRLRAKEEKVEDLENASVRGFLRSINSI